MKYEAVFGDQNRFNEQNNEMAEVMLWHDCLGPNFVSLKELSRMNSEGSIPHGSVVLAMRRIIAEPKRWTVADQKAGKLPEVGCRIYVPIMFEEQNVIYSSEKVIVSISDNGGAVTRTEVASINLIKPIETPEEKAQRFRKEWCNKALSSCSILSGMQKYELKRLGGYIEDIYDALLSGDLSTPVQAKDGE